MKRSKKLLILLAALIVCAALAVFAGIFLSEDEEDSSGIVLNEYTSSSLEKIKWVYQGETVELVKEDSQWYYASDRDFPLSEDKVTDIISGLASVKAVRKVTDTPEELSTYGIDDPTVRLYVTAQGVEHEYDIGNYNESTGYYYMMHTGDTALYYTDSSLYALFAVSLMDIVEFEFIPDVDKSDVTKMTLATQSGEITVLPEDAGYIISGSSELCEESAVEAMLDAFVNISWISCSAYNVTQEDLALYGLDSPSAQFTVYYKYTVEQESESGSQSAQMNGMDTLLIGSSSGEEEYYAMIKGGKNVYTVSRSVAENYFISSEESLYSKSLLTFASEDLTGITVTYGSEVYEITPSENLENDSGMEYTLNGETVALDNFVEPLLSLTAQSVQKTDITGYGDAMFTAVFTCGGESQTVTVYKYDEDLCVVSLNGRTRYFADENDCDDIAQALEEALK